MTKVNEKFVEFGTGAGQVGDKSLPSVYSPSNYTPSQVGAEGADKVSAHLKGIDSTIGGLVAGGAINIKDESGLLTGGPFSVLNFVGAVVTAAPDGSISGQCNITVFAANATFRDQLFIADGIESEFNSLKNITADGCLDVFFNGIRAEEGKDYQRDSTDNTIETLDGALSPAALPNHTRIRSRVYSAGFVHFDEFFDADGIVTEYTINQNFTDDNLIDVYFNGTLAKEGTDWSRDSGTNKIISIDESPSSPIALPDNTRVLVRVHGTADYLNEYFSGGVISVTPTVLFTTGDRIDVYIDGRLGEEGNDWTRDVGQNEIDFPETLDAGASVLVRVWE